LPHRLDRAHRLCGGRRATGVAHLRHQRWPAVLSNAEATNQPLGINREYWMASKPALTSPETAHPLPRAVVTMNEPSARRTPRDIASTARRWANLERKANLGCHPKIYQSLVVPARTDKASGPGDTKVSNNVTPATLRDPFQNELLDIVVEECAAVLRNLANLRGASVNGNAKAIETAYAEASPETGHLAFTIELECRHG